MTTHSSKSLQADGNKIRALREKQGWSQKQLIHEASVGGRTVQRAEKGDRVSPLNLSQIAKALNVPVNEITKEPKENLANQTTKESRHELLVLKQTSSARVIRKAIVGSTLNFDFDVDPTEEVAEKIAKVIENIESQKGNIEIATSPSSKIRKFGQLNSLVQALLEDGIHMYVGNYNYTSVRENNGRSEEISDSGYILDQDSRTLIIFSDVDTTSLTRKQFINMTLEKGYEELKHKEEEGYETLDWAVPF